MTDLPLTAGNRRLLPTREVAQILGVSTDVVLELAAEGLLRPHPAFVEGRWKRFSMETVDRFLAGDTRPQDPEAA